MELITRRIAGIIKDLPTARVTLTGELQDIGLALDKDRDERVWVSLVKDENGKKVILIEPFILDA